LDDKQGYYYQGAYADCVRAVDFLATRPEVDQKRIGVTGGSQGGGLSLATAALDARIRLCAPDIPFLCDWVKYFKASHWPEMDKWIAEKPERTWPNTLRTLSYFDTLNLADRIRCPVLMSLGVQDGVCPPSTVFSVYNRLKHRKQFRAYPDAGHRVPAAHRALRTEWIAREFATQGSD
jgi:cephalosporin-C deacetylase-like acetyl esterase